MGQESKCVLRQGSEKHVGKALLETSEIIFRSETLRLRIPFAKMKSVGADAGELRVETANGSLIFELGSVAEKWREKILHPKSRIEKLGVKTGSHVVLLGNFDGDFLKELKGATRQVSGGGPVPEADLIFTAMEAKKDLRQVSGASKRLKGAAGLWVVYPKGKKEITEMDVISAGRKAGLKDVKVVGFSPTHTALKFVLPLAKR